MQGLRRLQSAGHLQSSAHRDEGSTVLPCRISIFSENQGCTIATVRPTSLLEATGLGVASLAEEVEREVLAIIDEAA